MCFSFSRSQPDSARLRRSSAAGREGFAACSVCAGGESSRLIVFTGSQSVWPIVRSDSLRCLQTSDSGGEILPVAAAQIDIWNRPRRPSGVFSRVASVGFGSGALR